MIDELLRQLNAIARDVEGNRREAVGNNYLVLGGAPPSGALLPGVFQWDDPDTQTTNWQIIPLPFGQGVALLLNAYATGFGGGITAVGNTKYSVGAGAYNTRAIMVLMTGNGGIFEIYVSPVSTGADTNVVWPAPFFRHDTGVNTWLAATYAGSWATFGGFAAAYFKMPTNQVRLRGQVTGGAVGTTIFTLPAGYRPPNTEQFAVATNTGYGRVDVSNGGVVTLQSGGTGWVSLANITFLTV